MKKKILFIFTLFFVLVGFNQQERIVVQSNTDLFGRASVAGKAPEILQRLKSCSVDEGGIAVFLAELAQIDASYEIAWYKDKEDVQIKADSRVKIYLDKTTATLVINNLGKNDAGIYKIHVKNADGKVESKAELTVRPE